MSNSTFEPLAVGMLLDGKYRLARPIGRGAMGEVWAAVNQATSREVAVKLILGSSPELRLRLLREARSCGALKHPNVIDVYDIAQTKSGEPFLVMELLAGETLAQTLQQKRRLDPSEAVRVALAMARALAAAHAIGIVHRDLKPANVFLHKPPGVEEPIVKVLDFGVAKNILSDDGLHTTLGGIVGTPAFMSPEQARADRDVDHRADIWSLGVALFQMLTGTLPFRGEPEEILRKIKKGPVPTIAALIRNAQPELDTIVSRCMRRDRDDRFRSAAEVAARLESMTLRGPGGAVEDAATIRIVRSARVPSSGSIEPERASSPNAVAPASLHVPIPAGPPGSAPGGAPDRHSPTPAPASSRDRGSSAPSPMESRMAAEVAEVAERPGGSPMRALASQSSTAPLVRSKREARGAGDASREMATSSARRSSRKGRPVVVIGGAILGVGALAGVIAYVVLIQRPAALFSTPATPAAAEGMGSRTAEVVGAPSPRLPASIASELTSSAPAPSGPAPSEPAPSLSTLPRMESVPAPPSTNANSSKAAISAGAEAGAAPSRGNSGNNANSDKSAKTTKSVASTGTAKAPSKGPRDSASAGAPVGPAPPAGVADPWGTGKPPASGNKPLADGDLLFRNRR